VLDILRPRGGSTCQASIFQSRGATSKKNSSCTAAKPTNSHNRTFQKLDIFPSSSEKDGEAYLQWGPLERTSQSYWSSSWGFFFGMLDSG
jgi:hypothetical protein